MPPEGEPRSTQSDSREALAKLNPGSPTEPSPFGKYYLLGLIARGGMAEVYRARLRKDSERLLAIKCMRPQLAREARFVDMFIREGKLALLLKHPSIVATYDVGRIEGRYFIAMEYIGGKDLTQVLRRCQEANQRIPVPHAVYIAARIAEGLHYAHTLVGEDGRPLNIVNRDVSPSNVRISYSGDVKLLDFGIAQALMKFTSEIGVLKGKFSYMSPEQIRGMPVDARTDIFSAGIILHEMLTTEKLFRGDTEFALMEKVRKAEVPPPSKFNRRVTPELDAICLKALARDVGDRYQTGAQFASDLNRLLEGYRFNPTELQEFVRQLFRADYAKEVEEVNAAKTSLPPDERPAAPVPAEFAAGSAPAPAAEAREVSFDAEPPSAEELASADTPPVRGRPATAPPPLGGPARANEDKKSGFWAKITSRFKK